MELPPMRTLRSRRSLPDSRLKTPVSSPEPFTPPITDSSQNTFETDTTASSVISSRRRLSLRLANRVSSSSAVEVDECAGKRKSNSDVSVHSFSSDLSEELRSQVQSGSGMSRKKLKTGSDQVEEEEDVVAGFREGCPGDSVEEKVTKTRVEGKPKNSVTLASSPKPLTPCTITTPVADISCSKRKLIQQVSIAADDGSSKRKQPSMVSDGTPNDDDAIEEVQMVVSFNGAGPSARAGEEASNAMELITISEGLEQDIVRHILEGKVREEVSPPSEKEATYMTLRSGSKVLKRKVGNDSLLISKDLDGFSSREVKKIKSLYPDSGCIEESVNSSFINLREVVTERAEGESSCNEIRAEDGLVKIVKFDSEDKEIRKQVLQDPLLNESDVGFNVDSVSKSLHEEIVLGDDLIHLRRSKRYSQKEKGKEKLVTEEIEITEGEQSTKGEIEFSNINQFREQKSGDRVVKTRSRRETARNIAIELAPRFAFFKDEKDKIDEEVEMDDSMDDTRAEEDDWPGPFSTAMKIIEKRESILKARSLNICSEKENIEVKIPWKPSREKPLSVGKPAPSLKDLCLKILCDNAEEIESLEGLPDVIKYKIVTLLCGSRKMTPHVLHLLTKGSPMEIYLRDCSWMTEKQFEEVFSQCNIDGLKVLELGFCGRCLPDYVLHSTLSRAPNCLSSLDRLSLYGAYCLSDSGLDAIIASAPSLKSVNLSHCSLITSKGIISLAAKLESFLQELFIDFCNNVDAMLILPALKKLKCLEVLSLAHLETVTDKFLKSLIPITGPKLRGLIVAGCCKLTNASVKTIGASCPCLSCLDIRYLSRLNDSSLEHLANGGCPFQSLKICRSSFSDEAVAAFIEAAGATLFELELNGIEKAAGNTALAISRRCSSLRKLDLSFCRNMSDEALGLIVDSCSNLRVLKLFGCTQITNLFLDGHSNPLVKIVDLKGSSILDGIEL